MKRTHKRQALGDVGEVVRLAGSVAAAAAQLGVERSTVHRWIKAGKVPMPPWMGGASADQVSARPGQSPEEWAAWVRQTFSVDQNRETLLGLAVHMLIEARTADRLADRIAATAQYRQLLKQLNLQEPTEGKGRPSAPVARSAVVPRAGGDPRLLLRAVK